MEKVIDIAKKARQASREMIFLSTYTKNQILQAMADELRNNFQQIIEANSLDVKKSQDEKTSAALIDRLTLDKNRINSMAQGLEIVKDLADPIGEIIEGYKRPNGLEILSKRVPLGVVGIIYEARPNVTVDAIGLCLKTSNAVILRGSSSAINSNKKIVELLIAAGKKLGLPENAISLIEDTDRESVNELIKLNGLIDVVIPRGGAGLINNVVQNATVPTIETGVGNCHVYIDEDADFAKAKSIIINAKISRPSVCNAAETLLVHQNFPLQYFQDILAELINLKVQLRGCSITNKVNPNVKLASEEDYSTEFLDYILAVKVVASIEEAIEHIHKYGTKHTEAIVTENYSQANLFTQHVDAAAVMVNASTRFTDGFEFGFGAEIGISTQKLHARGPMGLKAITTNKYVVNGNGQVRI